MLKPRPGVMEISPYVGGEASASGVNRVIRLAANENPLGPSPTAIAAYEAEKGELHRYPDGGAHALRKAISAQEGIPADQIVCGAGSDELISLLVRAYAGVDDEVLYSAHGFLMYSLAARTVGAHPVTAPEANLTTDVDAFLVRVTPRTRLVFVANPNNPTGTYLSRTELARLHAGLPSDVLLVIDAAYAEYCDAADYSNGAELVARHDNVVMTRTFSKIHGLASLRLGWAYCPPAVADVLHRVRGPFNVGQAAQAAGVAAINDRAYAEQSKEQNKRIRAWFGEKAAAMGLTVVPSQGNFVLLRFPDGPQAAERTLVALKSRGILLRAMGGYGLPESLRVTIGTEEEMHITADALQEVLSDGGA
ncbi:MAG: histidinol-phosphate transaminase [Pseudomonadota bacterium]